MAFSGVSFANTIEEVIPVKESATEAPTATEAVGDPADCNTFKFQVYAAARAAGFSHNEATSYSYNAYFKCMGAEAIKMQEEGFQKPKP